ncbi:kinase domain-containing protein [Aspergillus nomiae NRRL 13137]|uniref:Kinase domain-containing protein n=1 Tax=Aspergillus nomiae NRRL (strain ATCC 15546 / NRRL 13137 / CBS 260.88 / M93) TaxID=1509407 RepID=A0A0L1IL08_ASPN3|nr:kinase domain-containing protein [Aspergillus nomiae NRRL 13137]KNG80264.1 kinase domain-containing protein [Aspergillus nomiae NRRL 13137]
MAGIGTPPSSVPAALPDAKDDGIEDPGDFVRTEDEEVDLEEVAEPWEKYSIKETSRVFYPVYLGEVLNERYLVEHKLGHGGFSTVWMARDLQSDRDVALKVMSSGEYGENEIQMQDKIVQVLVLPLMGPCLYPAILRTMSMASRMSAARQLLGARENLHKAGIVHRGNCTWGMAPLPTLNRKAKYKALGRPLKEVLPFVDLWKQGELVQPIQIPEALRTDDFYLGDFGLAMQVGDPTFQPGYPPMQFGSPDRLHKKEPSFACDMWSYMAIFTELYLGYPPFATWLEGGVITGMVKCLGPLPEQWKGLYNYSGGLDSWYDQHQTPDPNYDLAAIIAYYRPNADPVEREHVHSIMSKVFNYCPEKRPTATELLQDHSFRAIMDKYGC